MLWKQLQQLSNSTISNPKSYKSLLQKIGKLSFFEYSFENEIGIRKRISNLSEAEIDMILGRLEKGNRSRNRRIIEQLNTLKSLKARLYIVGNLIDRNKRIVDDIPDTAEPPSIANQSIPLEPQFMKSEEKRESLYTIGEVTKASEPSSQLDQNPNVINNSFAQFTPATDKDTLNAIPSEPERVIPEETPHKIEEEQKSRALAREHAIEAEQVSYEEAKRRKMELEPERRRRLGWGFSIGGGVLAFASACVTLLLLFYAFSEEAAAAVKSGGVMAIIVPFACVIPFLGIGVGLFYLGIMRLRSPKTT